MKRFLVVFSLALLFFVSGCSNDKNNEHKDDVTNQSRNMTEEEKEKIMQVIDDLTYLDFYGKSFKTTDLTNQEVLQFVYEYLGDVDGMSFIELESVASKYLNFSLEPENIICASHFNISLSSEDLYIYDGSTGKYYYNPEHLGHGKGGIRTYVLNKYVSSKVNDDTYEVVVYKIFSDILDDVSYSDMKMNFYSSYNDSANKKNVLFSDTYDNAEKYFADLIEEGKLIEYKYIFKLNNNNNNNYILNKYEIGEKKEA